MPFLPHDFIFLWPKSRHIPLVLFVWINFLFPTGLLKPATAPFQNEGVGKRMEGGSENRRSSEHFIMK
jgi:hypothetical protein